jgi:hypothetical protein
MQNGGLFPVGPYDEMMAPKQGNYLLPDINRPSYIDDEGGRRSEYKMGVNIDNKEILLPTVVGGRQLTEDQAEAQYMRTGLNMGKFNNVEDADYASRLRTARYNMLEDPIRFNQNQFQEGGDITDLNTMKNAYDYTKKYYNSPKFKERFINANLNSYGYGPTMNKIIDEEYNSTLSKINNNLNSGSYYLLQGERHQPIFDALIREYKGRPNPEREGIGSHFDSRTNTTFVYKDEKNDNNEKFGVSFIAPHEFSHQAISGINTMPLKQREEIKNMQLRKNLHLNNPNETKADIDAFRYYLYKNNIYNPMTEDFTQEHLEKYKKIDNKAYKRLEEMYLDSDIIHLMNTVAKDYNINNNKNYVKYGGQIKSYQEGGEKSTEQNPTRMAPINVKGKMPKVNWYESIDPRNWGLRDYSAVDDYSTAYNRAKLSGQDEFYWKDKRYNTKYAGPINEEIATYGVKGQKVDPKDYITVYQYPYLDKDYLPSHIAADQSAQISKLAMSFSDSNWDKSKKFFDYFQTQIQPNTPYRTRSDEESLLHFPPVVNYGLRGNMQTIQNNMSLPNRKEYRVYGVDPVTFFKKSNNLDKEVYKDIGYNWNLITNNCADNVCDAFGVPRDRGITTPQDAVDKIKNKYPTLEVTGRSSQSVYKYGGLQQSYKKTKRFK